MKYLSKDGLSYLITKFKSIFATKEELENLEYDTLKNKPSFKTINSQTITGTGNLEISGGTTNYNDLTNKPTFKTINNQSILGTGDITIEGGGSIVDLGTFNNQTELITHAVMNQLPTGHYTFIMGIYPYFMLLREKEYYYRGTFQNSEGITVIFEVTKTGVINYLLDVDIIGELTDLKDLKVDKTYVDNKVKTDVPVGAKFTDTVYTHPVSHPASMITESSTKRFVSDSEKSTWNSKSDTDTVTTINGKTGAITKADIVALGIPAQDTVYTHPAGTNPHGTTKSDVGLSNVDNVKQMPISGGVLENYREKLTTVSASGGSIDLSLGNVFVHTPSGNMTYSITNAVSGQAHSFTLIVNMGSTVRTLTFPASVKWQGGEIPDMSTANKTYVLTFMTVDSGTNWLGMFGGEF